MLNANKDYPENKQRFLLNKKKEPLVRPTPPSVSVPGPSNQNMLGFGTFVKKPTKSGLSHAVLYHIGMQAGCRLSITATIRLQGWIQGWKTDRVIIDASAESMLRGRLRE